MNLSREREALRACAIQATLALAQEYFSFTAPSGSTGVPLDQAHVFTARRTDLWKSWSNLPQAVHRLFGRLWQVLRDEGDLAQREAFFEAALEYAVEPTALFAVPEGADLDGVRWVQARHQQEPLALAAQLVAQAEVYREMLDAPLPTATPGLWSFGPDGACTVRIPESEKGARTEPVALSTAPFWTAPTCPAPPSGSSSGNRLRPCPTGSAGSRA